LRWRSTRESTSPASPRSSSPKQAS
jgi:hypothetical protein